MRTTTKSIDLISKKQICTCGAHFWTFPCRCFARLKHQSIPVMPSPPPPFPGYCGAVAHLVSPGGGTLQILLCPEAGAFAYRAFDTLAVFYQNIVTTQRMEKQAD